MLRSTRDRERSPPPERQADRRKATGRDQPFKADFSPLAHQERLAEGLRGGKVVAENILKQPALLFG